MQAEQHCGDLQERRGPSQSDQADHQRARTKASGEARQSCHQHQEGAVGAGVNEGAQAMSLAWMRLTPASVICFQATSSEPLAAAEAKSILRERAEVRPTMETSGCKDA